MFLRADEIFERTIRDTLPADRASGFNNMPADKDMIVHGTTCVALVNQAGVVVAADGRGTYGGTVIATESVQKLFDLDRHSVLAVAGALASAQNMARVLKAQFLHEADKAEGAASTHIPSKTKVNTVARLVRQSGLAANLGVAVFPMLGLYDTDRDDPGGRVFVVLPDGALKPESQVDAVGSGSQTAMVSIMSKLDAILGVSKRDFDSVYFKDCLPVGIAKELAIYGLASAHQVDGATGTNISMVVVGENGISPVSQDEIVLILEKTKTGRIGS